jgi:hypothetical protein
VRADVTENVTPFQVTRPAEIIADRRERLQRTCWPEQLPGYALTDPPTGQAAWIFRHCFRRTDNRD